MLKLTKMIIQFVFNF